MTIANPLGKAEKDIELDRDQWAALDKISFKIETRGDGEAIGGPFYFGRAFDSAPFFTFSAVAETESVGSGPQLTVGVAEWIQDGQGMYTGANLWFKYKHTDHFDQLDGCRPTSTYGDQVLHDPGFEGHHVRGPLNNELPVLTGFGGGFPGRTILWNSTYPAVVETIEKGTDISQKYPWVQQDIVPLQVPPALDAVWHDEHSVVHSGAHSILFDYGPLGSGIGKLHASPRLFPMGTTSCTTGRPAGQFFGVGDQFGWPVLPGYEVTMSAWVRATGPFPDTSANASVSIGATMYSQFRNLSETTGPGSDPFHSFRLTDFWQFTKKRIFVPGDVAVPGFLPIMAQPYIVTRRPSIPTQYFLGKAYVDDLKLTIKGGTSGTTPVSTPGFVSSPDVNFQVDLRFNGQILKSYAHVHPVRSYEHPAQVVLS